jgi:hypothetical protein
MAMTVAAMTVIDWYSLASITAIFVSFCVVRKIPLYLIVCCIVILVFAWTTRDFLLSTPVLWLVTCAGLGLATFGLLIVRVMFIRSVSLQLLSRPQTALNDEFTRDIGSRLDDMRGFRLIRNGRAGEATLTGFGKFVGSIITALYAAFRIKV